MVRKVLVIRGASAEKQEVARDLRRNMTAAEKMLWTELRRRSCAGYSFRRQQVLLGYIVDFYCHRGKLIVELDGPIHDYQTANDEERTRALTKAGFRVLRFKNEEVYESTDEVVWKIIHKFQE